MFYENAQSTMLTMLRQAAGSDLELRQNALEQFCSIYSQPLVDFLRATKKLDQEDAEEVVQSFWSDRFFRKGDPSPFVIKFLEKRQEHPELSFRKYLARSLAFHSISIGRKRAKQREVSLDAIEGWEPLEASEQDVFDVAWANHILVRVLESVRRECVMKDQLKLWQLFEAQALQPAMTGAEPLGYAKLAQQFGFRNPKAASNAMQTVARKFDRVFVEVISDYLPTGAAEVSREVVDAEIQKLMSVLSRSGSLKVNQPESQDGTWSTGYVVAMQKDSLAEFQLAKFGDQHMFAGVADLAAAWNDLRELPLVDWLLTATSEESMVRLSLADALTVEQASVEVYDQIRSQAKVMGHRKAMDASEQTGAIPRDFYATTYLLAIVAAELHSGIRISSQSPSEVARKAMSSGQLEWLDESSKRLLSGYVSRLG